MKTASILVLAYACAATTTGCSRSDAPTAPRTPTMMAKGADTGPSSAATSGTVKSEAGPPPVALNPATPSSPGSATALTEPDRMFFMQAAQSGYLEIEASKLAATQATDPAIKTFASTMVADHTAADAELKRLAAQKNVKLPENDAGAHKDDLDRLKKLKGQEFDRSYAKTIGVAAHTEAVSLFEKTSTSASDQDVKDFAAKTLPTLRHHLEMAKALPYASGAASAMR